MQALENLAGTGQLIHEPASAIEISGFLERAAQQLADARIAKLSASSLPPSPHSLKVTS